MTEDAPSTGSEAPRGFPNDPPPPPTPAATPADRPSAAPPPPPPPVADGDRPSRPGMSMLPIAVGVGLLAAAVVLSALRSRSDGDLDWSNYSVGVGATAALLLVAVAALVLGARRTARSGVDLVTWPGAVGILAAGVVLGVGLEDVAGSEDWLAYLVGGVVALLSVVGYVVTRRGAFVVTAIVGLGLVYVQLADDVWVDIGDDDDRAIIAAASVAVFVLAITAVGWLLPTRALSGVVAGVIGLVGLNIVLLALAVTQAIASFFGGFGTGGDLGGVADGPGWMAMTGGESSRPDFDNDVFVILAIAAGLTLLWALAAALDGNPGFTVLAIALPATIVPTATFVLAVEHPTWWGAGLAAAGAVLLVLVAAGQVLRRRSAESRGS